MKSEDCIDWKDKPFVPIVGGRNYNNRMRARYQEERFSDDIVLRDWMLLVYNGVAMATPIAVGLEMILK